jgi:hypothetical protein
MFCTPFESIGPGGGICGVFDHVCAAPSAAAPADWPLLLLLLTRVTSAGCGAGAALDPLTEMAPVEGLTAMLAAVLSPAAERAERENV